MSITLSENHNNPSICFVSHFAYGELASVDTGHIGGVERQTSMMAKWLARHGYKVSMLTWDEGQADGVEIDGVKVFKMCRRDAGINGLRFFWPKWTSLNAAMKRADADIYYQNCGGYETGQVALWCRINKRKFVYSVANDMDCDIRLPVMNTLRDRIFYRYGLKHADSVIVQTQHQQKMLNDGFGIQSIVIPMPCEGVDSNKKFVKESLPQKNSSVLWVGRISEQKRFEWLIDIAKKCPDITFDVLGLANSESEYSNALIKHSSNVPNIKIHGRIPHEDIFKYYCGSRVLCCTSSYEGFPNTFLEAWSCGIPVVSTFDPDGIISKYNLGWTASSVDEMVNAVKESMRNQDKWQAASMSAREYFLKKHTLDSSMEQFVRIFQDVHKQV
ncbi:MAG: glycosyltransferase family 4 protein [Sedimentisphaerales bacterium]|nr:glycosyltransferase family 4 protein [Sedimentisphaerales bacterium]